jgi:hypothetical protein
MRSSEFIFLCLPVLVSACGTSGNGGPQQSSGSASGTGAQSGSSASGTPSSGASTGDTSASGSSGASTGAGGTGSASGMSSGGSTGSASGATSGATSGSGGIDGGSSDAAPLTLPDGAVNMVPAGYTGTPFVTNTIPGFIYAANYDKGGPSVAYCHTGTGTTAALCAGGIHLTDWCCSDCNATMTGARCDDRDQHLGACPLYRPDSDNAGLSHMNLGEVDTYANAGPTWVPGPNGPTLTGTPVTVGTPVPQHPNMTTQDDTYIGYMNTGEWSKYTVQVLAAGAYSIGGLLGVPPGTKITLDFGNGITTGMITLPASPVTPACKCIEAYHAWTNMSNVGMVTFPAAGTYLMTFTLNALQFNPLYFTFRKM